MVNIEQNLVQASRHSCLGGDLKSDSRKLGSDHKILDISETTITANDCYG